MSKWEKAMREIDQKEQIAIKRELLQEFHELCTAHGLKYSLGYGSLLGAVRHSGMIPWDDDIDIVMPRKDYDRLSDLFCAHECRDRYQVVNHRNHPEIKTKISYYIDFDTIMEVAGVRKEYHGIHIDIYPVDVLPDNSLAKKRILIKRKLLHNLIKAKDVHPELLQGTARLVRKAARLLVAPFNYDNVLDRLNSLGTKDFEDKAGKEACVLVESGREQTFPCSVMEGYRLYPYDGNMYYGFDNYDEPLKAWYGDYLTPPPEEDRKVPEHKWVHYYYKDTADEQTVKD